MSASLLWRHRPATFLATAVAYIFKNRGPWEGTMSDQLPMFILQSIVIFGLVGVLFIRA
jgi:hypothetical protein